MRRILSSFLLLVFVFIALNTFTENKYVYAETTQKDTTTQTSTTTQTVATEVYGTKVTFSDVKPTDWFYADVMKVSAKGLVKGYEDGTFRPDDKISRNEFLAMTLRALGYNNLNVEDGQDWAYPYIQKGKELRILAPDATDAYNNYFKKYDMVRILVAADKDRVYPSNLYDYQNQILWINQMSSDLNLVKAYVSGLIKGYPTKNENEMVDLGYYDFVTRAEACTVILRLLDKTRPTTKLIENPVLPVVPQWIDPEIVAYQGSKVYEGEIFTIGILNYKDYLIPNKEYKELDESEKYKVTITCTNYPEFNTYYSFNPLNGKVALQHRDRTIYIFKPTQGEIYYVAKLNNTGEYDNFIITDNMTLSFKITFEKNGVSKDYYIDVPIEDINNGKTITCSN